MKMERTDSQVDSAEQQAIEQELQRVPYIAEKRAPNFRSAGYTSPADVANADASELVTEVYGVGPKTAERVLKGARGMCLDSGEDEVTDAEIDAAREAHATTEPETVTDLKGEVRDQERDVEQSGAPLSAIEGLDGSTLDLSEDDDEEVESAPEVTAEQFERRLTTREGGTEFWYRCPDTEALLLPYEAPGFENWCEARGRDPEDFQ